MIDAAQRNQLIVETLGLVRSQAAALKDRFGGSVTFDELVEAGQRGLTEAAQRWEPDREASFSTFAHYRIRGAMLDLMRLQAKERREKEALRFASAANSLLADRADAPRPAGPGDPRQQLGQLAGSLGQLGTAYVVAVVPAESDDLSTADARNGFHAVARRESAALVRQAIDKLPEGQRAIIRMHYYEDIDLKTAGERLGLSKSWASRLHARAIAALRESLVARGLGP